jgi:tripartite-type tricarboxylate transporter receptor subunit TctC
MPGSRPFFHVTVGFPACACVFGLGLFAPACAQEYPTRPIRLVTSAAGGAGDVVSRTVAQVIASPLRQPVIVDNRGALPGIEVVARARPDGYTLLLTSNIFWLLRLLQKVSFDPLRDFTHIALVVSSPNVNLAASNPHVKTGRLRALAVTSPQPSPPAPELPAVASAGLAGYESEAIYGMFAPAALPLPIVHRLNEEATRALHQPEVRERFIAMGYRVVAGSASELSARVAAESERMGKVVAQAGIRLGAGAQ